MATSRYRTGDAELDARLLEVLAEAGAERDVDQLFEILVSAVRLAADGADRLDLKITNAALREMREAFRLFAPYRDVPKVTIFGSARTLPDDPLYVQTRELAAALAAAGWIIVTGAGPGIMAAGFEGAIEFEVVVPVESGDAPPADWWVVEVKGRKATARRGRAAEPVATVRTSLPALVRMVAGTLMPIAAVIDGLVSLDGDIMVASRVPEMFGGL